METTIEIIGAEYKCPKCGETDSRNLEICDGNVIGCECGYNKVPAWAVCPCCGESDMDEIIPPTDDEFFRCLTCGETYRIFKGGDMKWIPKLHFSFYLCGNARGRKKLLFHLPFHYDHRLFYIMFHHRVHIEIGLWFCRMPDNCIG